MHPGGPIVSPTHPPVRRRRRFAALLLVGALAASAIAGALANPSSAVVVFGPDAPYPPSLTPLDGEAIVGWGMPASNGNVIQGYRIEVQPSGALHDISPAQLQALLPLENGVDHRIRVGTKWAGGIAWSKYSGPATPSACGPAGPGPFVDVALDHLFCQPIEWMDAMDIASGYGDGTFRPADTVTRGAMAQLLFASQGSISVLVPTEPTFTDVPTDHPFFTAVEWMVTNGLTGGYPDGTFRPGDPVTRQPAAAFITALYTVGPVVVPGGPSFTDVPPSHPFYGPIEWMRDAKAAGGFPDGTFHPAAPVSRQAAAKFLYRVRPLNETLLGS